MKDRQIIFRFLSAKTPSGPGLPRSLGLYITHNDAQQSVGLLWMSASTGMSVFWRLKQFFFSEV
jgi:hypothetical protein